ncbi:hypothetical protein EI94DRAFT_1701848 [Lactarius quietus]|nr:hypothetical protein EI94DRAFT_1701848 [Lactarius quietus]
MDPTKPHGDVCTPSGSLKEADDIVWFNDPDDASAISIDDNDLAKALKQQKRKKKTRALTETNLKSNSDKISLNEGPNQSKTCVFSQVPEDSTQNTHANTKGSNKSGGSENMPSRELDMRDGGLSSDDDEDGWDYSQLDKMAMKDAKTWLMGNVYTCCTHIIRQWVMHKEPYLEGCQCEKVEPNWCILCVVGKALEETRQLQE